MIFVESRSITLTKKPKYKKEVSTVGKVTICSRHVRRRGQSEFRQKKKRVKITGVELSLRVNKELNY